MIVIVPCQGSSFSPLSCGWWHSGLFSPGQAGYKDPRKEATNSENLKDEKPAMAGILLQKELHSH